MPRPSEKELEKLIAKAREALEAGRVKLEASRILDLKILLEACHRSNIGYYERIEKLENELRVLRENSHGSKDCLLDSSRADCPDNPANGSDRLLSLAAPAANHLSVPAP